MGSTGVSVGTHKHMSPYTTHERPAPKDEPKIVSPAYAFPGDDAPIVTPPTEQAERVRFVISFHALRMWVYDEKEFTGVAYHCVDKPTITALLAVLQRLVELPDAFVRSMGRTQPRELINLSVKDKPFTLQMGFSGSHLVKLVMRSGKPEDGDSLVVHQPWSGWRGC